MLHAVYEYYTCNNIIRVVHGLHIIIIVYENMKHNIYQYHYVVLQADKAEHWISARRALCTANGNLHSSHGKCVKYRFTWESTQLTW